MSNLQPLVVYSSGPAPNPYKVAFVLEELGLPWKFESLPMPDLKKEPYTNLNPNGRVPTLVDPNNNDMTIWESGAIVDYLIEQYDQEARLHYTTPKERSDTRSWQYFQVSGQGPYFGQLGWFTNHHHEKVPSAVERYTNEVRRVIGVVDAHLARTGADFLVGDRATYADLMFLPYFKSVGRGKLMATDVDTGEWAHYTAWLGRLHERPAVARVAAIYDGVWEKILAAKH
ncbi:putative glutathione-s-transferase gst [Rosellinia necatrix]|uniref:Putative glutathione-s-transferase gst n=1 Tax=Rosellinia necatrix TaxID=77044 RepID=A0A1W2TRL5_ROSNE|nr:putative glutathione-s-transferase gst [Rosellinia necatrix]